MASPQDHSLDAWVTGAEDLEKTLDQLRSAFSKKRLPQHAPAKPDDKDKKPEDKNKPDDKDKNKKPEDDKKPDKDKKPEDKSDDDKPDDHEPHKPEFPGMIRRTAPEKIVLGPDRKKPGKSGGDKSSFG